MEMWKVQQQCGKHKRVEDKSFSIKVLFDIILEADQTQGQFSSFASLVWMSEM